MSLQYHSPYSVNRPFEAGSHLHALDSFIRVPEFFKHFRSIFQNRHEIVFVFRMVDRHLHVFLVMLGKFFVPANHKRLYCSWQRGKELVESMGFWKLWRLNRQEAFQVKLTRERLEYENRNQENEPVFFRVVDGESFSRNSKRFRAQVNPLRVNCHAFSASALPAAISPQLPASKSHSSELSEFASSPRAYVQTGAALASLARSFQKRIRIRAEVQR